jgi:carboxylesterase
VVGVLLVHGLTGEPRSVAGMARALAARGHPTSTPLLPGHGTTPADLAATTWADWVAATEDAYAELAAACGRVVVGGLSVGGSLACRLAASHPEVAGLVVVNPFVDPPAPSFREILRTALAQGVRSVPKVGGDIADPDRRDAEQTYDELPIPALLSLCEGLDELPPLLPSITCPVLVMTSRTDHVVPPVSSDVLAERVSGPVERVWLERSWHVATLDHDREEIGRRAVEFVAKLAGG